MRVMATDGKPMIDLIQFVGYTLFIFVLGSWFGMQNANK